MLAMRTDFFDVGGVFGFFLWVCFVVVVVVLFLSLTLPYENPEEYQLYA